jgi:hypothetical protein
MLSTAILISSSNPRDTIYYISVTALHDKSIGLTGSEIGDIRDMKALLSAKGEKVNFIVGSNTFASAEYIYNKTFT